MAWFKKKEKPLQYELTPAQRAEISTTLKKYGLEGVLMPMIDGPSDPVLTTGYAMDKNSYAFWGPTTATLVNAPKSMFFPISYDAYKVSGMDFEFKSKQLRPAYQEVFQTAAKIYQWTQENNLNEFFLKNANFSAKHFWPFTCHVDLSHMMDTSANNKIGKILLHIHNINSHAMIHWATPGLGFLVREKLDLKPEFYAFGAKFYKLVNKTTGQYTILPTYNTNNVVTEYINERRKKEPDVMLETMHIGMPITKELRIFSIGGDIQGYVPYWTPVAFQGKSVYGLPDGAKFDDVLRKMNTFEKSDLQYLHGETKKIINHPTFSDTDWAIDWVLTRDGKWYMIDMQTAKTSYMDVENMIFAKPESQHIVYDFIESQRQGLVKTLQQLTPVHRAIALLSRHSLNIDKAMQNFGYPNQKKLNQIRKQIGAKTI